MGLRPLDVGAAAGGWKQKLLIAVSSGYNGGYFVAEVAYLSGLTAVSLVSWASSGVVAA